MCDRKISAFEMLVLLLLTIIPSRAATQEKPKPLDPNDARLTFSFPVQRGGKPLDFKVQLDKQGTISAVSVYSEGASDQLQKLPACVEFPDSPNENWDNSEISMLITHADLNFDGFEDLELLHNYIPHLDKKVYCIYLWDSKNGRFSYSKELTAISVNLEAHPENKTLTGREDWQGGLWQESKYRWRRRKLELIEQNSLLEDPRSLDTKTECEFIFSCSKWVKRGIVPTLTQPVCTPINELPECLGADARPLPKPLHPKQHGIHSY